MRHFVRAAFLTSLSILSVSSGRSVHAAQVIPPVPGSEPISAAMSLHEDATYDLQGQTIRCEAGQTVGLHVQARLNLTVSNAVVEGCDIGVLVTTAVGQDQAQVTLNGLTVHGDRTATDTPAGRSQAVRIKAIDGTICVWLAGDHGVATGNIVGGCTWGWLVTGHDYQLLRNQSYDNVKDGFLVTGKSNLFEDNVSLRNGQAGFRVTGVFPAIGPQRAIHRVGRSVSNTFLGNTALDNSIDLFEVFATADECSFPGLPNTWLGNTFGTSNPQCIQ